MGADHQRGFTLIELLIAATVSAVVMTAVYAAYAGAVQSKQRVERVAAANQEWRFLAERLRRDLRSLHWSAGSFRGLPDRLAFAIRSEDGTPAQVEYRLETTPAGGEVRRRAAGPEAERVNRLHLGVDRLAFRYRGPKGWTETAADLPRAVECSIAGRDWERRITVLIELGAAE